MPLPNIFANNSSPEDEIFMNDDVFLERPFSNTYIDSSSEDLEQETDENLENENPFNEVFTKKKSKKTEIKIHNWSRKAFTLNKTNTLIRSAPQLLGSSVWESVNNGEKITLPTLGCGKSDSIKRISADMLVCLMNQTFQRDFLVIDARFKYEYEGGHVKYAININNEEDIMKLDKKPDILVFYCEYSSIRGPSLARKLRNLDRLSNKYPKLDFPEIYVLEGGYKTFFEKYPSFCTPVNYIQMHDERFKKECAYYHKKIKIKKN